jgi:carbamate kinase
MSTLNDYTVEIDETDGQRVVLIVPAPRLIVLGQTLAEARALANAAITFGGGGIEPAPIPSRAAAGDQDGVSATLQSDTAQAA